MKKISTKKHVIVSVLYRIVTRVQTYYVPLVHPVTSY